MIKLFQFLGLIIFTNLVLAQSYLRSGPMLGYSGTNETMIWLQTYEPSEVKILIKEKGGAGEVKSPVLQSQDANANVIKYLAQGLQPGKTYSYEIFVNGEQVTRPYSFEFKTKMGWKAGTQPPSFSFAAGSCNYISEIEHSKRTKSIADYEIFESILSKKPDFMLWLGDNTYLLKDKDWVTMEGIFAKHNHARSLPERQSLLAGTNHYAIWDDHDFGPDDGDRNFPFKNLTGEAFELFWANPPFTGYLNPGINSFYKYYDSEFYLLDNRSFRTPYFGNSSVKTVLGPEQLKWLISSLASSKAIFKFIIIGGQFLNPVEKGENYANYKEERRQIIEEINKRKIKNVVFITGDRHFSELTTIKLKDGERIYDITSSPLTSAPKLFADQETNYLRVHGSSITAKNFAYISVSGPLDHRVLNLQYFSTSGKLLWSKNIEAEYPGVKINK